jgi:hypothetical protein
MKGHKMSYSFDRVSSDRWSDLSDGYQSMIDELENDDTEIVFVPVDDFDLDEVL